MKVDTGYGLRFKLRLTPDDFGYDVYVIDRGAEDMATGRQKISVGKPVEFEETKQRGMAEYRNPTFRLQEHEAQNLLDALWGLGLRPTEMRKQDVPVETLMAKEANLVDLRGEVGFLRGLVVEGGSTRGGA